MTRQLVLRVTVKDGERALFTRDGRLERVLERAATACSIPWAGARSSCIR